MNLSQSCDACRQRKPGRVRMAVSTSHLPRSRRVSLQHGHLNCVNLASPRCSDVVPWAAISACEANVRLQHGNMYARNVVLREYIGMPLAREIEWPENESGLMANCSCHYDEDAIGSLRAVLVTRQAKLVSSKL